jgi:hypothetical protein
MTRSSPSLATKMGSASAKQPSVIRTRDPIAWLEVWHPRFSARDPLANPHDDFVLDGEVVLVEAHVLDNPARPTNGVPVVVDLIQLDEKISGEERVLYRNLPPLPCFSI